MFFFVESKFKFKAGVLEFWIDDAKKLKYWNANFIILNVTHVFKRSPSRIEPVLTELRRMFISSTK